MWPVGEWCCCCLTPSLAGNIKDLRIRVVRRAGSKILIPPCRMSSNQVTTFEKPKLTSPLWIEMRKYNYKVSQNAKKVYFRTIKYDNMCFLHFYCNDRIQIYFQTSSFIKLYSNIAKTTDPSDNYTIKRCSWPDKKSFTFSRFFLFSQKCAMRNGSSLESNNTTTHDRPIPGESRLFFLLLERLFYLDSFSRNVGQRCVLPVGGAKKKKKKDVEVQPNFNGITRAGRGETFLF